MDVIDLAAIKRSFGVRKGRRHRTFGLKRLSSTRAGVLDRAEDILTSILNLATDGVIVTDADTKILVFSGGAEAIFGYTASEVIGRPVELLIPPEFRTVHRDHVAAFKARQVASSRMRGVVQTMGVHKTGALVPIEVDLSRLQGERGEIITAIVRDVTERVEAERALSEAAMAAEAASRAKSEFLAAMSHEIRTPLNGILGMAQAMAQGDLSPRQRDRLAIIRDSGEGLLQILNDLLDLSKIEAGKLTLEEAEFDLEDLLNGACAIFSPLAAQKGLEYGCALSPGARGRYIGDPLRLRQLLHNLISNAIKFTKSGRVDVSVTGESGRLLLTVTDTGIGISADRVARIFDTFEQADVSTMRQFGGTGLGLSICKQLVELMGGSIDVRSEEGKGSAFTVILPMKRAVVQRASKVEPPVRVGDVDGRARILVAEDNPTNQAVIRALLEAAGLTCVVTADGQAALDAWHQGDWDLILMDVQMPGMDGPTATATIRAIEAEEARPRVPIIGVTANVMSHQVEEYVASGMDAVVSKPIQMAELLGAIRQVAA